MKFLFLFVFMIQKSKFEIIENLIVQTYKNLNIIDDYSENQIYIKDNNDSFKLLHEKIAQMNY